MFIDSQKIKTANRATALLDLPFCNHIYSNVTELDQKLNALIALPKAQILLKSDHWLASRWMALSLRQKIAVLSLIAIEQEQLFQFDPQKIIEGEKKWRAFLDCLEHTEDFYADIGGIIGYHAKVIDRLFCPQTTNKRKRFLPPPRIDFSKDSQKLDSAIQTALCKWESTALIIPAGGAGDRLNLLGEEGAPQPAAFLTLDGKTLLESIICDLTGCEHAAFMLTGKKIATPIAIMTSFEKDNHALITDYLKEKNWFGRPQESFCLFCQPSVPMLSSTGMWVCTGPLQLLTKPGGHGVLWRLAHRLGVFDWLDRLGCQKAIVRQINNCLAGCDTGLLALAGWGWQSGKSMGFASCARVHGMAEGVNAVVQTSGVDELIYSLENIEYNELTGDFEENCDQTQRYLANVNLLFIDLKTIEALSINFPLPGLTINFKTQLANRSDDEGVVAGRLESTMQNISSYLTYKTGNQSTDIDMERLPTFSIFCERSKILSAAKRARSCSSFIETPEMAYLDLHRSYFALLKSCGFSMPLWEERAPPAVIALHSALGPDWRIIGQKIKGGNIEKHSELRLEIAELDSENLQLSGSLQIICEPKSGIQREILLQGRCSLRNVIVKNRGVVDQPDSDYWSERPKVAESWKIILCGESEFCADNITLTGSQTVRVPDGCKMTAFQNGSDVVLTIAPLENPIWRWECRLKNGEWQLNR